MMMRPSLLTDKKPMVIQDSILKEVKTLVYCPECQQP